MRAAISFLAILLIVSLLGLATAAWQVASRLAAPAPSVPGEPPRGTGWEGVSIPRADGSQVAGWYGRGEAGCAGILLLHPIRTDRRTMVRRAQRLQAAGYSVLLVDLHAHGETPGAHITFGHHEGKDAVLAAEALREKVDGAPVGAIGVSLGGAAIVLGGAPVDAAVLESVYSDIRSAIDARLRVRFGSVGPLLTPLFLMQLSLRLDIAIDELRPEKRMDALGAAVLILGGAEDRLATPDDARRLHEAADEPRQLVLFPEVGHVDLSASAIAYWPVVTAFLQEHLGACSVAVRPEPVEGR